MKKNAIIFQNYFFEIDFSSEEFTKKKFKTEIGNKL